MAVDTAPKLSEIQEARERLAGVARVTPVYGSETLSKLAGRDVCLKAENLQRTGSFKVRGATNKIATLSKGERRAGVVAASAGNHGQAVAWAAREAGIKATIFMPQDAPMAKVEPTKNYGAKAELQGATFEEALDAARDYVRSSGATFIHPYEDERVIAGQGTIGLEIVDQVPDVETVVVPVGGGGLCSGIALALRAAKPGVRIVGVQAGLEGFTLADGIAVKSVGELTSRILEDNLDDMVSVTDEEICSAIVLLLERSKLVVEGAGAVGVAALLSGKAGREDRALAVLSGGNIDPTMLISVMRHGLTLSGRYLVLRTRLQDRPGELIKLLKSVAHERANILSVEHHREGMDLPVTQTEVELTVAMRDEHHCSVLLESLRSLGYQVERLR
ncbi:MAG TPA: pyridoxal-phosphate dependent enzyme [Gaiellaceae bacterium]|nr:pyridoxal-phosphate dependent enzyme [Gaiellaceae bacterium]